MTDHPSGNPAEMKGPLSGVRVIDLTNVVMGPLATHVLADLGADVIKIEAPEGDLLRAYQPARSRGMSGMFLHLNRNKRSVVLDLKRAPARVALDRLIAGADVFLHSLRPKAIARLGYDYDRVRRIKPDIVYCGAHGFGSNGRYADKAAYDDLIQAGSGLAVLQEAAHGKMGYLPTIIADKAAGQVVAYSILAALYQRATTGIGQSVEVPMYETMVEFTMVEHMGGLSFDPVMGKAGYSRVLSQNRKPYRTRDGYACILPYSDRNWRDFFEFIDRPEFAADERYALLENRAHHIDMLYAEIEKEAAKRTTEEWMTFCDSVSIPCIPVKRLEELIDDPHLDDVGFFTIEEHPSEGRYRAMRMPTRFSAAPFSIRRFAPRLGADTQEVLQEAGLEPAEIAAAIGEADAA